MLQKDFWSMSDEEIKRLANKYNIELPLRWVDKAGFDRAKVISRLQARDGALQTNYTLLISIFSLLLSVWLLA